jgi:hydroxymethylbilane synthase
LKKLDDLENGYAALILARAGVERMGWEDRISQTLDNDVMLHAVGQGALGLECREGDLEVIELLKPLACLKSTIRCLAEREFMKALEGGCSVPLGVSTLLSEGTLLLIGSVTSIDGSKQLRHEAEVALTSDHENNCNQAIGLGAQVAKKLKDMGALAILDEIKANK